MSILDTLNKIEESKKKRETAGEIIGVEKEKLPPLSEVKLKEQAVKKTEFEKQMEEVKKAPSWIQILPGELLRTAGGILGYEPGMLAEYKELTKGQKWYEQVWGVAKEVPGAIEKVGKEIVKAPFRVAATIVEPWINTAYGLEPIEEKPIKLPVLGEVPTMFYSYQQMRKAGMSPLESGLMAGSQTALDLAISAGFAQYFLSKFPVKVNSGEFTPTVKPDGSLKMTFGKSLKDTKPIMKEAKYYNMGKVRNPIGGTSDMVLEVVPTASKTIKITGYNISPSQFQYNLNQIGRTLKEIGITYTQQPPEVRSIILPDTVTDLMAGRLTAPPPAAGLTVVPPLVVKPPVTPAPAPVAPEMITPPTPKTQLEKVSEIITKVEATKAVQPTAPKLQITAKGKKALGKELVPEEKVELETAEEMEKLRAEAEKARKEALSSTFEEAISKAEKEGAKSIYKTPYTQADYIIAKIFAGEPIPEELNSLAVNMVEQGGLEQVPKGQGTEIDMAGMFFETEETIKEGRKYSYKFLSPEDGGLDKATYEEFYEKNLDEVSKMDWRELQEGSGVETKLKMGDLISSKEIPDFKTVTKGKNKGKVLEIPGFGIVQDIFDDGSMIAITKDGYQKLDFYGVKEVLEAELTEGDKTKIAELRDLEENPQKIKKAVPKEKPVEKVKPERIYAPSEEGAVAISVGGVTSIPSSKIPPTAPTLRKLLEDLSNISAKSTPFSSETLKIPSEVFKKYRNLIEEVFSAINKDDTILSLLYKKAVDNVNSLAKLSKDLAPDGQVRIDIKTPNSIVEKVIIKRIQGDENYTFDDINDVLRATVVAKDKMEISEMIAKIDEKIIIGDTDYFATPNKYGYRGRHIDIKLESGQITEIQFHTPETLKVRTELYKTIYKNNRILDKISPEVLKKSNGIANHILGEEGVEITGEVKKLLGIKEVKKPPVIKPEVKSEKIKPEPTEEEKPIPYELTGKGEKFVGRVKTIRKMAIKEFPATENRARIEKKIFDNFSSFALTSYALPILNSIAIDGNKIIATDLESGLVYTGKTDFKKKVVLPAKFLKGKGIPDIEELIARVPTEFKFEDYPMIPELPRKDLIESTIIRLDPKTLTKAISSIKKEERWGAGRPEIQGVYFHPTSDGSGMVVVSTDSFRLWKQTLPVPTGKDFKFILPRQSAVRLQKILDKVRPDGNLIRVKFTKNQISFEFDNFTFYSKLIEGDYPAYDAKDIGLLGKKMETTFEVNREEILDVLQEAKPYIAKLNDVGLSVDPKKNTLKITATTFKKEIPVVIEKNVKTNPADDQYILMQIKNDVGIEGTSYFNVNFLNDFLKNAQSEKVTGSLMKSQDALTVWKEVSIEQEAKFVRDLGKRVYIPAEKSKEFIMDLLEKSSSKPYIKRKQSFVTLQLKDRGYFFGREQTVQGPDDIADLMRELKNHDREKFYLVDLDKNGKILMIDNVSVGTVGSAMIHPREVLKSVILSGSKKVYLVHNHPSGNVQASEDDIIINTRLNKVLKELEIEPQGHLIMNRVGYGFLSPEGDFTEMNMPLETRQRAKMRMVEIEQRFQDLPEKIDKPIRRADDVVDVMGLVLNRESPTIVGLYLDARNKINGIEIIDFSLKDPHKIGRRIMRNSVLNNAVGIILGTNKILSGDPTIAAFQVIEDKLKLLGVDLIDVVDLQKSSLISRKLIGKDRATMPYEVTKTFDKYAVREPEAEYGMFTPEEQEALTYIQKGEPVPDNLKSAVQGLIDKGIIRTAKVKVSRVKKLEEMTELEKRVVQQAFVIKKLSPTIFNRIKNVISGHKRTKIYDLTEAQQTELLESLIDLTPEKFGKIKLVNEETLEAMRDFIPPSVLERRFITTGDIMKNLDEKQVDYLVSLSRPIRNVLTNGTLTPDHRKIGEKIYDTISETEENYKIEYQEWHNKFRGLYNEARKVDKNVDLNVFGYIEQSWQVPAKTQELAEFLKTFYADSLPVMKPRRIRQKYITHTAPAFWEKVNSVGLRNTIKEVVSESIDQREGISPAIMAALEYITSKVKFNPYALPRSQYAAYSRQLRKAVPGYASLYFYKKNFDPIMPKVLIMKRFLPGSTQVYVTKYLQTVGGRPLDFRLWQSPVGRTLKKAITLGVRFEYGTLLGLNFSSALGNIAGGTITNIADMKAGQIALGHQRLATKQGIKILEKYRLTEQTLYLDPVGGTWDKLSKLEKGLFGLMQGGEFYLRGSTSLGLIPKNEFKTGVLSSETRSIIRRQIGRTQGLFGPAQAALISQTTLLRPVWMFKHWMVNEMELLHSFSKDMVSTIRKNKSWYGRTVKNKGLVSITKWALLMFLLYAYGPEFLKKEVRQVLGVPVSLFKGFLSWADSVPLVEDTFTAMNIIVRLGNNEIAEAREDFQSWLLSKPAFSKFRNFFNAYTKGMTVTPDGYVQEKIDKTEAFKRLFVGSYTVRQQTEKRLNEELSKILPMDTYTKWDYTFGSRKIKTDYQREKEKIMKAIEDKGYWNPEEQSIKIDKEIERMYGVYNGQVKNRLDKWFEERDKLTGETSTQDEKDSMLLKTTIQDTDIANWFETAYELRTVPRILRRTR